jgi:hypothetical protein
MTPLDMPANSSAAEILQTKRAGSHTPIATGKWTLEQLLSLSQQEGIELWRTLPSPTLEEMNGHYTGYIPSHQDLGEFAANMHSETSPVGYWLGKAFHPLDSKVGEGYNRWRFPGGRVERSLQMATRVADSIIDGKPCYVLDYGAMNPRMSLYDELRKLDDGVLIGTASTAMPDGSRSPLSMFVLIGPTDEWVGGPYGVSVLA